MTPIAGVDLRTMWRIVNRGAINYADPAQVALETALNANPPGSQFKDYANAYGPGGQWFDNWVMNLAVCSDATLDFYTHKYPNGPNDLLAAWHRKPDADPRMQSWAALSAGIGRTA